MPKTIDSLEECCIANVIPSVPVLVDYFGLDNLSNEDNIIIILGLYIKMLTIWNINKKVIEKAFKHNELDQLIHETYNKHGKTGYYQFFCNKNIKIGETCLI